MGLCEVNKMFWTVFTIFKNILDYVGQLSQGTETWVCTYLFNLMSLEVEVAEQLPPSRSRVPECGQDQDRQYLEERRQDSNGFWSPDARKDSNPN